MEGIEILSTRIIYDTILPWWCVLIGVSGMIIFIVSLIIAVSEDCTWLAGIFGVLIIVSLTLWICGTAIDKNDIDYIEHKVTISDEVSLVEFLEKYEIIERDGEIYIIREIQK